MNDKKKSVRLLREMENVVYDKQFAKQNPDKKLYEVYRGLKKDNTLRYDVTIIRPGMLGKELVRTKGNMNSEGYQELYTVLEGEALFFMQKLNKNQASNATAIRAEAGNWIIVPPYYWLIIINPSLTEVLETGNWVSEKTENIYKPLEEMGGPCYFYTETGWIKNKNYAKIPPLRREKPLLVKPESLDFLREGMGK